MGWPQPRAEAVEAALAWLREQDPRLSLESLAAKLRERGYEESDIRAAVGLRQAEQDAARPAGSDLRGRAAAILLAVFFGTWLVFALILSGPGSSGYGYGQAAAIVLAIVLGFIGLLSLLGIYVSGRLKRGAEGALVAVLAVPFVFLVIVAGLCVATTGGLQV